MLSLHRPPGFQYTIPKYAYAVPPPVKRLQHIVYAYAVPPPRASRTFNIVHMLSLHRPQGLQYKRTTHAYAVPPSVKRF